MIKCPCQSSNFTSNSKADVESSELAPQSDQQLALSYFGADSLVCCHGEGHRGPIILCNIICQIDDYTTQWSLLPCLARLFALKDSQDQPFLLKKACSGVLQKSALFRLSLRFGPSFYAFETCYIELHSEKDPSELESTKGSL